MGNKTSFPNASTGQVETYSGIATKFFVSLPTHESQGKPHPTGIFSGPTQKLHPLISKEIEDLLQEGSTDPKEVQRALREYVRNQCSTSKPSPTDRAY